MASAEIIDVGIDEFANSCRMRFADSSNKPDEGRRKFSIKDSLNVSSAEAVLDKKESRPDIAKYVAHSIFSIFGKNSQDCM